MVPAFQPYDRSIHFRCSNQVTFTGIFAAFQKEKPLLKSCYCYFVAWGTQSYLLYQSFHSSISIDRIQFIIILNIDGIYKSICTSICTNGNPSQIVGPVSITVEHHKNTRLTLICFVSMISSLLVILPVSFISCTTFYIVIVSCTTPGYIFEFIFTIFRIKYLEF